MHCKSIIVGFLLSLLCLQMSYSQKDSLQAVCLAHLNSSENDHSIWAGKDFILFTSDRNSHFAGKNPENGLYYEQIYISEKHQQYLTKPRLKKFSLARNHYGIAGQSDNPSVVLLYTGQDEEGEILLIRVNEGKKRWKAQKILFSPEMQKIRKTSAFLNEKTGELFICAEIGDDTFGGSDIYILTQNEKNKWANPVNAGNVLNSVGNEEGVFMWGDTLFFASTGHQSAASFNIYYSVRENGKWSEPVLLPEPFNSPWNDLYYVRCENDVYFSSDRPGGSGEFDIYTVAMPVFQQVPEVAQLYFYKRTGESLDNNNASPLKSKILIIEAETDEIIDSVFTDEKDGSFQLKLPGSKNYKLVFSAAGYDSFTEVLMISELKMDSMLNKNVQLQKTPVEVIEVNEQVEAFSKLISTISDRIIYYQVQVGAFRYIKNIREFRSKYAQLDDETLICEQEGDIYKYLISQKFYEKDADCYSMTTTLQMKVILQYDIQDAFIVAYTDQDKRIAIIWSFSERIYKILNSEY